jgi:hypothetical protein
LVFLAVLVLQTATHKHQLPLVMGVCFLAEALSGLMEAV